MRKLKFQQLSNLFQRTISGVVYLVIVVGSLLLGKYAFGAVFLIAGLLSLMEYYRIVDVKFYSPAGIFGILAGAFIFILSFLVAGGNLNTGYLTLIALLPVSALIIALYVSDNAVKHLSRVFFGLLYIILPISLFNGIVFPPHNDYQFTHRIALGLLTMIWINDTGAYVTGISFGQHKLFPRISPKKSWEGLVGGTLFTLAAAFFMHRIMGILNVTDWIVLAVVVSIFGVFGDLAESQMKRNANMKDSGDLIPGHGGVLDRFDSLLFVIPVAYCYLVIV
jgi:phosphatidate cytidylyltransferase